MEFRRKMRARQLIFVLIILGITAVSLSAQESSLTLGEPDTTEFPLVRVNVQALGPNNIPLTDTQLDSLRLRENGVPISDFDLRTVPVGADILFVIDADSTLLQEDVDETARLETVREIISRYAARFMSPSGLDRVSVIVPNRTNTGADFLVEDAAIQENVVNTVAAYDPQNLAEAGPVNDLLLEAIEHAADMQTDGRYQAIFLLSDARRLNQFLDYEALTAAAQTAGVPIFVGILGPEAALEDIGNASALADPTGGFYVHAPRADESDAVFLRWQQMSNQPQISYRSLLRQSGVYPIAVSLGETTATTEMELTIEPPQADFALERSVVRRAGTAVDTPLSDLQPTIQPVPVQITWPDGRPRPLTNVTFTVNDILQPLLEIPQPDENGVLTLDWNVQNVDVGAYELAVTLEDESGYTAVAEPVVVTVSVERPLPPTPTPAPTPSPQAVEQVAELAALPRNTLLTLLAGLGLLGLVLVMVRGLKRYRERTLIAQARSERHAAWQRSRQEKEAAVPAEEAIPMQLTLLWLDEALQVKQRFAIEADNVTLGRSEVTGQIVLSDRSVSPLHARVRLRNGRHWLYDEGSESGTFLNHERLGLSPREINDGDLIQLGRISLRTQLRPPGTAQAETMAENAAEDVVEIIDEPNDTQPDGDESPTTNEDDHE